MTLDGENLKVGVRVSGGERDRKMTKAFANQQERDCGDEAVSWRREQMILVW